MLIRLRLSLLAVPLVLAACAPAQGAAGHGAVGPADAASVGTVGEAPPPETATMVCSDEFRGDVAQVLALTTPAPAEGSWADPVYTCTHRLPMGPLVLTVEVSPDPAAAADRFAARATELGQTAAAPGLGDRAFSTATGVVVVVKDDMTLTVDATGLPAVFGANGQQRNDLAYEVASVVLGCWTGHG